MWDEGGTSLASGSPKSSRAIAAELNQIYSHETVRQKLRELGVALDEEVEFPGGRTPFRDPEADEAELAVELADEARGHLDSVGSLFFDLDNEARRRLLGAAQELVTSLEKGERPPRFASAPLDI